MGVSLSAGASQPHCSTGQRLLSRKEVARRLSLSVKTVERMNGDTSPERRFPHPIEIVVPGRKRKILRWREKDIDDYIKNS